ncbi:MAG: hypothetical protein C0404_05115 [Verrucomicrobia bacterium]|nr:hypothetical protein [Verrucomicrobiota bacterium]
MRRSLVGVMLAVVLVGGAAGQDITSPQVLGLADVLRLALEKNPQLRAAKHGVKAADGRLLQAGAIPNPSLSAEVENFGGSGDAQGFDESETTIGFEQTIEMGKRSARKNVAAAEVKLAERDREVCRLDLIMETTGRFIDLLAAQEEMALSQEDWQTAQTIYQAVSNRVAAGKDSPLEEAKSRAELALARVGVEQAKSRIAVGRKALCALWAGSTSAMVLVRGDLAKAAHEIPEPAVLLEAMTRSPLWTRPADELQAAESMVRAERRSRIPDLNIGAGIRQSQADGSQAYVASVGFELPLFDWKRGNIMAAEGELGRKRAEQEAAQTALSTELATVHELLVTTLGAVETLTRDALPAAEQAFAVAQASYASGKTGYLDMQDARRSLIDVRRQRLATLVDYHRAVAQVERLTGLGLSEIKQK